MSILLSIDTDFFCREKWDWDFGHSEGNPIFMSDVVWATRYMSHDLYKETDPKKFADCMPRDFFDILRSKGFKFSPETKIGAGWSHKDAYTFFKGFCTKEDVLYNFDAHHDAGYEYLKKLECDNWVYFLKDKIKKAVQIYPKWKKREDECRPKYKVEYKTLNNVRGGEVKGIYLAQSPAWIPPHFDKYYKELSVGARVSCLKKTFDFDGQFVKRKMVSEREARKAFKQNQEVMKHVRGQLMQGTEATL